MRGGVAPLAVVVGLLIAGCGGGGPAQADRNRAVTEAAVAYHKAKASGTNLGPVHRAPVHRTNSSCFQKPKMANEQPANHSGAIRPLSVRTNPGAFDRLLFLLPPMTLI